MLGRTSRSCKLWGGEGEGALHHPEILLLDIIDSSVDLSAKFQCRKKR